MQQLPDEAATLLKIYLSGGTVPGNVNPLVLIEMARETGEYSEIFAEARAIRAVRQRIREFAIARGLAGQSEPELLQAYLQSLDSSSRTEIERLFWLIETCEFQPE